MSLDHYDPHPPENQQVSMALALHTGEKYDVSLPSTSTGRGKATPGLAKKSSQPGFGLMPMPVPSTSFAVPKSLPAKRKHSYDIASELSSDESFATPPRASLKFRFKKTPKISNREQNEEVESSDEFVMIQEPQETVVTHEEAPEPQEIVVKSPTSPVVFAENKENRPLAKVDNPNMAALMILINQDQKLQEKLSSERNALYRDLINKL